MKPKFSIANCAEYTAVNCRTRAEAITLLTYLDKLGYTWCNGQRYSPTKLNWDVDEENTCYDARCGCYGSRDSFIEQGYTILKFRDFDWSGRKPRFDIEDYPGKYVMHCRNAEQDTAFREYLHSTGREWSSGQSYLHAADSVCIAVFGYIDFNMGFRDSQQYYKDRNYIILEFDDYNWAKPKPKFDINDYTIKDRCVMHCPTAEAADIFCKYMDSIGRTWGNDDTRYTEDNRWLDCRDETCYNLSDDTYCSLEYANEYCTVLEFDSFDWSDRDMASEETESEPKPKERSYIMIGQDVLLDYLNQNLTFVRAAKGNEVAINILEAIIKDIDEWRD